MAELKLTHEQNLAHLEALAQRDCNNYERYCNGARVFIEEGEVGGYVSEGTLTSLGRETVCLTSYLQWSATLEGIQNFEGSEKIRPTLRLATRTMRLDKIASIQFVQDVLKTKPYNGVFQIT